MRPGDFSPGNAPSGCSRRSPADDASMRPGDFSPGNYMSRRLDTIWRVNTASMRPGDFSPGNCEYHPGVDRRRHAGFNEAGGFLPRKRAPAMARLAPRRQALQ